MKLVWTLDAMQDRLDIWDYIAQDSSLAAIEMDELFSAAAARLESHPMLGRAGKIPGSRELIAHENYRLVYEIVQQTIWILALVHTSRQWPPTGHTRRGSPQ